MSTHFFGLTDRTYEYSHSVGRNEFAGTGFRNPTDMVVDADGVVYIVNRSYENRPDGVRVTACTLDEEYISEFGTYGEEDGNFMWPAGLATGTSEERLFRHRRMAQPGHHYVQGRRVPGQVGHGRLRRR